MTDRNERLKSIRERLSAATPGPWRASVDGDYLKRVAETDTMNVFASVKVDIDQTADDAELIAHAPSDIEFLLALVERYEKALEFYADLKSWRTVTVSNKNQRFCIMTGADLEYFQEPNQDSYCGKRARKALEAGERE